MASSRTIRMGAMGGLVLALMMIVAFALDLTIITTTGGPPIIGMTLDRPILEVENISSDLLRAQGVAVWPVELWLYVLMTIPASLLALAAYRVLRTDHDDSLAAVGLLAITLFWIFHTIHNVLMLAVVQALVPHYASGGPGATATEVVTLTVMQISLTAFNFGTSVGALFLVGALVAFGLAILKRANLPRWTGYVALASGMMILGSYLQFLNSGFFFLGLLGWVLHIVWVIGVTLALLRLTDERRAVAQQGAT